MTKKFYMVTITEDPEFLTGKIYKTPEEAKEAVMKIIRESNAYENDGWIVDITGETSDDFEFPIKEFYIHTMEPPLLPDYLGEEVVGMVDGLMAADIDNEGILASHMGKEGIKELNKIIHDFLEKKIDESDLGESVWTEKAEVEDE